MQITSCSTVCDQCRSRKIRCGRERPQCSNCTRLGLECEWLGQGKRPNQTTWLSHAVTRLGDRLEKLENVISNMQTSIPSQETEATSFQATTPPLSSSSRSYGRRSSIKNVGGHERYYGSTSLLSLIQDMVAVIQTNLCDAEQDSAGIDITIITSAKEELIQLTESHEAHRRVFDGSILSSPPQVIIEAMIDPYFEMVNPYMPIWTKNGFRRLISSHGQLFDASKRRAYDVCANNLVLLTLQAKSLQSRTAPSSIPFVESPPAPSIDDDLVKSFIANAKRALENLELLLLSPSLLSLQALLSLCVVAQISLSEHVTALLFSLAVHVAKSIGLYQWSSSDHQDRQGSGEFEDMLQVMYCMVCLSRAIPWSSGLSSTLSGLSTFERDLASHSGTDLTKRLPSQISLLKIEEQVYSSLYSDQATRQTENEIAKTALSLSRKLQDWSTQHPSCVREDDGYDAALDISKYELAIRFCSIQALVEWPLVADTETSHSLLDISRRTLGLFLSVWRAPQERMHHLVLALLVASYPPVAFFELSRHTLCSQQVADDDLELLQSFINMVHTFSKWAEAHSFMNKLSRFGLIVIHLINSRRENTCSNSSGTDDTPPHPVASTQAYMHTLGIYPGAVNGVAQLYGGDSVASSSTHSNSTPMSGGVQPKQAMSDTETVPAPEIAASNMSTSLGSYESGFEGRISPIDELDGWIVDTRLSETMRTSLQPGDMTGFILQDNDDFSFGGIHLG
ncbi:hypothetical protein BGZ63DRAFT_246497 [Mariannaea sp. PMI_226]|nr:hypothetical protein BGZ63DRAFT_246497 [Mariannaea sp. PMI_226]